MPRLALPALAVIVLLASACGDKIGDSCSSAAECSQEGDRICDISQPGGYCTVEGCDFGTCPEDSVCVRFFPGSEAGDACATTDECQADEVCAVTGRCAPRSLERRYCMATCGDCRDGYECRDLDRMRAHGGEPVPDPETTEVSVPNNPFCAPALPCTVDADCDISGDTCQGKFPATRCAP